jgi:phytoene/squalene synthetase
MAREADRREEWLASYLTGGERLPFGERLEAWPLATLWTDAEV